MRGARASCAWAGSVAANSSSLLACDTAWLAPCRSDVVDVLGRRLVSTTGDLLVELPERLGLLGEPGRQAVKGLVGGEGIVGTLLPARREQRLRDPPCGACCRNAMFWSIRCCARCSASSLPSRTLRSVAASSVRTLSARRSARSSVRDLWRGSLT